MGKKTPLYQEHVQAGARMVDFSGWDMPLHYGSQLKEHQKVRKSVGMFDVSHMTILDVTGVQAKAYLRYLLANDIGKLHQSGRALYSCMLNSQGGVMDDLIVYYLDEQHYCLVMNSATHDNDIAWLKTQAEPFNVDITERADCAMIAVQGPEARAKVGLVLTVHQQQINSLAFFQGVVLPDGWFVARTGYTGEDGLEIILPAQEASPFWQALLGLGVQPCGLGARDTLRLEAGMNLYGADMDETTSPLSSNLAWTVAWEPHDRDFIGRSALMVEQSQGVKRQLLGLVLEENGVLRSHQKVKVDDIGEGEITSGSFSPTLNRSIAFARVPMGVGDHCLVEIRGKLLRAKVVKPPFVRQGKILV